MVMFPQLARTLIKNAVRATVAAIEETAVCVFTFSRGIGEAQQQKTTNK